MAVLLATLLTAISPADVIAHVIATAGTLDALAVITLATRLLNKDLRAYCAFKGNKLDDHFRT